MNRAVFYCKYQSNNSSGGLMLISYICELFQTLFVETDTQRFGQ